ncbi:hypothetical protein Sfum_3342 [Syntrophobacter fumaroxidans MPOB]|uniref:O-antigen polymerase n=2 Tax=Syntrophobacter TaxID=29526 RepID=A0LNL3_SYNFM|nr:hypothetical protein Sfum_3342 [Syntrophobacter fumaroxidans MPOB]
MLRRRPFRAQDLKHRNEDDFRFNRVEGLRQETPPVHGTRRLALKPDGARETNSHIMTIQYSLIFLTALVCLGAMIWVWIKYKETIHPVLIIGPLMFGAYAWTPFLGILEDAFPALIDSERLTIVLSVNLAFISAYFAGCLWQTKKIPRSAALSSFDEMLAFMRRLRPKVTKLAVFLAAFAHFGYWSGIIHSGGFLSAFGQAKGGGSTGVGYLDESMLAGFPAAIAFAASRSGRGKLARQLVCCALMMLPGLIQGTFGGRRGPLFLSLMTLMLCWFLIRGKQPTIKALAIATLVCSLAVLFWGSQRKHVYLGSTEGMEVDRFLESIQEERGSEGGTFTTGAALIVTSMESGKYNWGSRYLVTYFVRPIPRQFFEDKQQVYYWGTSGAPDAYDFLRVMGWEPLAGFATGFVADLFVEFSWGGLIVAFLYGALVGFVWRRARLLGGIWLMELCLAMMLSIYIPTQSVSAFLQRFLLMSGFCWIGWRLILQRDWRLWQSRLRLERQGRSVAPVPGLLR